MTSLDRAHRKPRTDAHLFHVSVQTLQDVNDKDHTIALCLRRRLGMHPIRPPAAGRVRLIRQHMPENVSRIGSIIGVELIDAREAVECARLEKDALVNVNVAVERVILGLVSRFGPGQSGRDDGGCRGGCRRCVPADT